MRAGRISCTGIPNSNPDPRCTASSGSAAANPHAAPESAKVSRFHDRAGRCARQSESAGLSLRIRDCEGITSFMSAGRRLRGAREFQGLALQPVEDRPTITVARGHRPAWVVCIHAEAISPFHRVRHLPCVILESRMKAHQESPRIGPPVYQPRPATAYNDPRVSASCDISPAAVGIKKNSRHGACAVLPCGPPESSHEGLAGIQRARSEPDPCEFLQSASTTSF